MTQSFAIMPVVDYMQYRFAIAVAVVDNQEKLGIEETKRIVHLLAEGTANVKFGTFDPDNFGQTQ